MQPTKGPLPPATPSKAPPMPHSGEGSDSALEARQRVIRAKPAARERCGSELSGHPV